MVRVMRRVTSGNGILIRLEKENETEVWKQLHVEGIDGVGCQHLQVMITLQKHW